MSKYMHEKEEKSSLDPQTVFTINHSDIPKGKTQCKFGEHKWQELNDKEMYCPICESAIIIK